MRIQISTELENHADLVWESVKRPRTLRHVAKGLLGFGGLDQLPANWEIGTEWKGRLFLFNFLPLWTHWLKIIDIDNNERQLLTEELGGPVSVWNHTLHVESLSPGRCRYTDHLEIHAGILTPAIWCFAQVFYRYRQSRWRKFAKTLKAHDVEP